MQLCFICSIQWEHSNSSVFAPIPCDLWHLWQCSSPWVKWFSWVNKCCLHFMQTVQWNLLPQSTSGVINTHLLLLMALFKQMKPASKKKKKDVFRDRPVVMYRRPQEGGSQGTGQLCSLRHCSCFCGSGLTQSHNKLLLLALLVKWPQICLPLQSPKPNIMPRVSPPA